MPVIKIFKAAFAYFALVFAAGFVLGTIRVLWIVPRVGPRTAELCEMPVMVLVSILVARWIVRHFALPKFSARLGAGLIALIFLVGAEVLVVMYVQRVTISQYVADRDPISGTAYLLSLLLVAAMPWLTRYHDT